jgi:hypothetical protein
MYKAAFPWSSLEEEETEKKYIKSLAETDSEEIAGNVWIPPTSALVLADAYGMRTWIEALLDPEPIAKGTHDPNKKIATPPRFVLPTSEATTLPPPTETTSRRRTLRSASPAKAPPTPSRKIATPRRTRRAKPAASSALAPTAESAEEAAALETSIEPESAKFDSIIASSEAAAKADAEAALEDEIPVSVSVRSDDTVKIDIETTTVPGVNGSSPTESVRAIVNVPASHPDLAQPSDPQAYLDMAKESIVAAHKLTASRTPGKKRKALEAFEDDESVTEFPEFDTVGSSAAVAPIEVDERPAKRQRITEIELRKEKIKKRATLGILTTMAMGYVCICFALFYHERLTNFILQCRGTVLGNLLPASLRLIAPRTRFPCDVFHVFEINLFRRPSFWRSFRFSNSTFQPLLAHWCVAFFIRSGHPFLSVDGTETGGGKRKIQRCFKGRGSLPLVPIHFLRARRFCFFWR